MTFEGKASPPKKGERYWEVRIPDLGIFTQGRSEKDAYSMAADAINAVIDKKSFLAEITPVGGGRFLVSANDSTPLIARWLYRLRIESGLTIREAAHRLGAVSPEAWARYESGRASPTIEKLTELLHAIDPDAKFTLRKTTASIFRKTG